MVAPVIALGRCPIVPNTALTYRALESAIAPTTLDNVFDADLGIDLLRLGATGAGH